MARCRVRVYEEKEIDPVLELFKDKCRLRDQIVDYQCLQKYDRRNKHFSMEVVTITEEEDEEKERIMRYDCLYRYETHEVKLEYDISIGKWSIVSDKYFVEDEKLLDSGLQRINCYSSVNMCYTLDDQIQHILRIFDDYFLKLDQAIEVQQYKEKMSKSSSVSPKENGLKCMKDKLLELSSVNPEDNEQQQEGKVDDGLDFPPMTPICGRRVIQSIHVHVQRKKKTFEKIAHVIKETELPTMNELGLEFLRVYDGKFNYPEGHTLVMYFRKKTWHLTIEQIRYVDCSVGESGPRSVLILNYKGQYTSVHV